ncbi:MAG TPA: hypothetical protein DCL44_04985 [Elusimicrobia bacterium]|nr:hypothetical protein [Elusimicrobiota bacterium]
MKEPLKTSLALMVFLLFAHAPLRGATWAENDYSFGSNNFAKDSFSFFSKISTRTVMALGVAFYKDGGIYRDKVYSLRLPVLYSGKNYFLSFRPFLYPAGLIKSSAHGARFSALTSLNGNLNPNYLHLTISGAIAEQKTGQNIGGTRIDKTFSQSAFGAQLEKAMDDQFFFSLSASGFTKPAGVKSRDLINPVLDQSELADLGTFKTVTALPELALVLQFARNMAPDFDSYFYAGFSRISFRQEAPADSAVFGLKLRLNETSSFDFAYNLYKQSTGPCKSYYKIFVQAFF